MSLSNSAFMVLIIAISVFGLGHALKGEHCEHDFDCRGKFDVCINQTCVWYDNPANWECVQHKDCPFKDNFCIDHKCRPKNYIDMDGECHLNDDCREDGALCVDNTCKINFASVPINKSCKNRYDCPNTHMYHCIGGICGILISSPPKTL